jgi:DivIVA domain-containing protein
VVGTALVYVVALLAVAAAFFAGAVAVFGRGEELAPIPPGATPTWLPDREVQAAHVRAVRFQQAVRGYKMAEVDWVLEQLAGELDDRAGECDGLRRRIVELESAMAGARQADVLREVGLGESYREPNSENGTASTPDLGSDGERTDPASDDRHSGPDGAVEQRPGSGHGAGE